MKILVRSPDSPEWKLVESKTFDKEDEIRSLIAEDPSVIPVGDIKEGAPPFVLTIKEFPAGGAGFLDVLAFNSVGDVALIECKLSSNPEVKRKVIGQILEYASFLWGMSYEDLDSKVKQLKGKSLVELLKHSLKGDDLEEFDEESFREGVREVLAEGTFILIIVVDEINESLRRIINYLNKRGGDTFSIHAVEMKMFKVGSSEMLVPKVYGISDKPSISKVRRRVWTEEEFFDVLSHNVDEKLFALFKDFYEWGKAQFNLVFGRGRRDGSVTFKVPGNDVSLLSFYTSGKMYLSFGSMKDKLDDALLEEFYEKLVKIEGFEHVRKDFSSYPKVDVKTVLSTSGEDFKKLLVWLKEKIKEAS